MGWNYIEKWQRAFDTGGIEGFRRINASHDDPVAVRNGAMPIGDIRYLQTHSKSSDRMVEATGSKMMSRLAIIISAIFFIVYGIAYTFGSIFLVSWGGTNGFKRLMIFMGSFPIDWDYLVVHQSNFFLLGNILFWSALVYGLVMTAENIVKQVRQHSK